MKKLTLSLDDLRVSTFPTAGHNVKASGTVAAHEGDWSDPYMGCYPISYFRTGCVEMCG